EVFPPPSSALTLRRRIVYRFAGRRIANSTSTNPPIGASRSVRASLCPNNGSNLSLLREAVPQCRSACSLPAAAGTAGTPFHRDRDACPPPREFGTARPHIP